MPKDETETQTAQGRAALPARAVPDDYLDAVSVAFEEAVDHFAHINGRGLNYDTMIFWGGATTFEVLMEVTDKNDKGVHGAT